jgi:DNA-binding transcriptional LysR family regulator
MDLLHALDTFVRVVETGSFSAVARETNVNGSAVTRLVGRLEEHFKVRLFHRTTRHLSLTEDGQELLDHARHLLNAAVTLEDSIGRQSQAPSGHVRVGVRPGTARLLTPRLGDLLGLYSGLSVEFVVRERFDDLIEDRLDLAIREGQPANTSLMVRSLGTFGRALVAASSYLEERGAPSTPADLPDHSCIVHNVGPASKRWRFTGPDGPYDIEVPSRFCSNDSEVVRHAARMGHGIALMYELQVLDDIMTDQLHRVLAEYPTDRTQIFLIYPSRQHLPPRTRVVIDFLVEQFRIVGSRAAGTRWCEFSTRRSDPIPAGEMAV